MTSPVQVRLRYAVSGGRVVVAGRAVTVRLPSLLMTIALVKATEHEMRVIESACDDPNRMTDKKIKKLKVERRREKAKGSPG
jgi:hypothetical protein